MNNNRQLNAVRDSVYNTVNNNGLSKLNPLFNQNPKPRISGSGINILFKSDSMSEENIHHEVFESGMPNPRTWLVISNEQIAIEIEEKYKQTKPVVTKDKDGQDIILRNQTSTPEIGIYQAQEIPIYIKTFSDVARDKFKRSVVMIKEMLPVSPFSVWFYRNIDINKQQEDALKLVAKYFVKSDEEDFETRVIKIIVNNKYSFKRKLDELLNLNSEMLQSPEYTYCPGCGERIKNRKYCDARESSKNKSKDRDNCLRKINYWITNNLGITDKDKISQTRVRIYNEMRLLASKFRFSAYEVFQENNPKLFEKRKRGRKPKISS